MNSYCPIDVKPLKNYLLLITFDNHERRIFDVAPYLDDDFFPSSQFRDLSNRKNKPYYRGVGGRN